MRRTLAESKARRVRWGLAGRFGLVVTLLSAVLAVQIALMSLADRKDRAVRFADQAARSEADLAAQEAGLAMQDPSGAALQRLAQRLADKPHVLAVEIYGVAGQSLLRIDASPTDRVEILPARARAAGIYVLNDRLIALAPMRSGGAELGLLRLEFAGDVTGRIDWADLAADLLLPFAVIALGVPLVILAARRATQPLRELTAFAEEVTAQRLTRRLDVRSGDEFETLARAFNHMMDRLEASMQRVRKLAFVDPVTELPNQDRFMREVRERLGALGKAEAGQAAVVAISVDKLNQLAESYGQEASQELLALVAHRLASASSAADRVVRNLAAAEAPCVLARLSGPEFGLLVPTVGDDDEAGRLAQHVAAALTQPVEWRGQRIVIEASAGVALLPRDAADADAALRQARLALKAARRDGRSVRFFTRALDQEAVARLTLEREMREGLEQNQFRAFFQPKVDLATGRIIGAEALARWVRPDRSVIGPGVFIPASEENGTIGAISDAILRDACWKAAAWARHGYPLHVAVNVSALQFSDDGFADNVMRALSLSGLPADRLELEITESIAMTDPERVVRMVEPLRAAGVRFAIDDFGTGHSSLASLSRLRFDILKIDQSFVHGLGADGYAPAIIETILAMAASLGFSTVAEGVEREDQASFLRLRGCEIAQGYLYGAPAPPAEFLARLRGEQPHAMKRA